jgi:hypothetical protein
MEKSFYRICFAKTVHHPHRCIDDGLEPVTLLHTDTIVDGATVEQPRDDKRMD